LLADSIQGHALKSAGQRICNTCSFTSWGRSALSPRWHSPSPRKDYFRSSTERK